MSCKICDKGEIQAIFHQILHKENRSNKVMQVVLIALTLIGVAFAILGGTPFLHSIATPLGIFGATISFFGWDSFRHYSSHESERKKKTSNENNDGESASLEPKESDWRQEPVWLQLEAGSVALEAGSRRMDNASRRRVDASKRRQESRNERDIEDRKLQESTERLVQTERELASLRTELGLLSTSESLNRVAEENDINDLHEQLRQVEIETSEVEGDLISLKEENTRLRRGIGGGLCLRYLLNTHLNN